MSAPATRVRSGCQNCRARHLKCDEGRPSCTRCKKAKIQCVRVGNIRFRHDYNPSITQKAAVAPNKRDYDFAKNQKWCRTDRKLNFVDETQDLIETFPVEEGTKPAAKGDEAAVPVAPRSNPSISGASIASNTPPASRDSNTTSVLWDTDATSYTTPTSPLKRRRLTEEGLNEQPPVMRHMTSNPSPLPAENAEQDRSRSLPTSLSETSPNLSLSPFATGNTLDLALNVTPQDFEVVLPPGPVVSEDQQWPLTEFEEAKLMRYWIDNLAHYLDMCDHQRHFATVVPYRAADCPPLLNAVFAAAARHKCRHGVGNPYVADQYHQKCLELLIPLLSDRAALLDEALLAAAVILRFHEEMEVAQTLTDMDSHLSGTHIFMKAQERNVAPGGLRQAAFWVGLRMDLFFAFMNSRPVLPTIAIRTIDKSLLPADDCAWANRMVATCAEALQYSFGDTDSQLATYDELVKYCDDWMTCTPPSFTPIYYREGSGGNIFPEYWVLSDAVGCGLAHYYLTKILLTAHNPKIPRLGPRQRIALREADQQIRQHVMTICGIAESNPKTPPYYVKACMAITMAGDRFTDKKQQDALVEVMQKSADLGWPVLHAVRHLKEAWDWKD